MVVIVVVCCPGSPEVARVASAGMESSGLKSSGLMKATPAPTSPLAQSQSPVRTPPCSSQWGSSSFENPCPFGKFFLFSF